MWKGYGIEQVWKFEMNYGICGIVLALIFSVIGFWIKLSVKEGNLDPIPRIRFWPQNLRFHSVSLLENLELFCIWIEQAFSSLAMGYGRYYYKIEQAFSSLAFSSVSLLRCLILEQWTWLLKYLCFDIKYLCFDIQDQTSFITAIFGSDFSESTIFSLVLRALLTCMRKCNL